MSFGPGNIAQAHTIDEYVPVDDLVDHAAAVALALRWCGVQVERVSCNGTGCERAGTLVDDCGRG